MIEVKDLRKDFGDLQVLQGITERIDQGEKVAVIGPSGSGKSTFLRCLNLLERPNQGRIALEGEDLALGVCAADRHDVGIAAEHLF